MSRVALLLPRVDRDLDIGYERRGRVTVEMEGGGRVHGSRDCHKRDCVGSQREDLGRQGDPKLVASL